MKKLLLSLLIVISFLSQSVAQITVTGSIGADGSYASLTNVDGAFHNLFMAPSQSGQNILITIENNVPDETGQYALYDKGWTTLTIIPSGHRTISGNSTESLLTLFSASHVVINGINDITSSLTISNLYIGNYTSTIAITGDASYNTIQNCTILGSVKGYFLSGTISLGDNGTTTGCDYNFIINNTIGSNGTAFQTAGIFSTGTSETITNDYNTVSGNNICDFYPTDSTDAAGICLASNNSGWTITNNRFYQTGIRSGMPRDNAMRAIYISTPNGGGYTITGNIMGYANPSGTGMLTNTGGRFAGIDLTAASALLSSIQNNFINGISWETSGLSSEYAVSGIIVRSGLVDIGTITGNIIGAATGNGTSSSNILLHSSYVAGLCGISAATNDHMNINNNTIGAISIITTDGQSSYFNGIKVSGSGTYKINSNNIGTSTLNSVSLGAVGVSDNSTTSIYGITNSASGSVIIGESGAGNIIQNLTCNSNGYGYTTAIESNGQTAGTLSICYNTIDYLNFTAESCGMICNGIEYHASFNAASLNTSYNTFGSHFANYTGTTGGTEYVNALAHIGEALDATIAFNVFDNLSIKLSGGIRFIENSVSIPETGFKNVHDNYILDSFTKEVGGGSVDCILDNGITPTGAVSTVTDNDFSHILSPGSDVTGISIYNSGNNPTLNVYNNSFSSIDCGSFLGLGLNDFGGTSGTPVEIYGNVMTDITVSGNHQATGMMLNGSNQYLDIHDNIFRDITLNGSTYCSGIYFGAGGTVFIHNNSIQNISGTSTGEILGVNVNTNTANVSVYHNYLNNYSTSGSVYGIVMKAAAGKIFEQKIIGSDDFSIYGMSTTGTESTVNGILVYGGSLADIYQNNIHDLSYAGTGSDAGQVNGLFVMMTCPTVNMFNNTIGKLTAPASNSPEAIRGITVTSTATGTYSVFYNTIFLDAVSTGTNFGSSAIYHNAIANPASAVLDMRNNILVNNSEAQGTGKARAYSRSNTALNNFAITSNNNILYAGIPSASHVIFSDNTNYDMTIEAYKARVAPRETASETEDVVFSSFDAADISYLHVDVNYPTLAESGGTSIPGYLIDIDGNFRQGVGGYTGTGTTTDIGADEFDGAREYIWTGLISDNWNIALNWIPNSVPKKKYSVIIPGGTPNPCIVKHLNMECKNMMILGGSVNLQNGTSLNINGNLTKQDESSVVNNGTLNVVGNIVQN